MEVFFLLWKLWYGFAMGILFPEWWLFNLIKKIEDIVMCCSLKVGNSDFNELAKKVKLILQQMWILLFNIPISQVIEKRITLDCEEGCDHREWSQDGQRVLLPELPSVSRLRESFWSFLVPEVRITMLIFWFQFFNLYR